MITVAELEVIHETRPLTIRECKEIRRQRFGIHGELYYQSQDHFNCILMRRELDRIKKK